MARTIWMVFPPLSMPPPLATLEQTSRKSLPDLLISGCSGALFWPVLAGDQATKTHSSAAIRSRRTAASNPRILLSDLHPLKEVPPTPRVFLEKSVEMIEKKKVVILVSTKECARYCRQKG